MNPQMLVPYSPFLALLFLVCALIQALRRRQQGVGTAFLALIAIGAPVAAYVLVDNPNVQVVLIQLMALNAVIVFIGSILILLIERGNPNRDMNRSYGMLGMGLAILLALGIFLTPMLAKALENSNGTSQTALNNGGSGNSALATVLTQQTGLSTADLTTQLNSGSTIAQLVSAHNGNLTAVTTAITAQLDQLTAAGGQSAALLSRLGSSSSDIATQMVQGQLPAQEQRFMVPILLGTGTGFGGNRTGNGQGGAQATQAVTNGGNGGFGGFGGNNTGNAQATEAAPNGNSGGFGGFGGNRTGNGQTGAQSTEAAPNGQGGNGGFGGFGGQNTTQATQAVQANSAVAQVLTQQTGLSASDLTMQVNSGSSTIADLVSAHQGNLSTVTTAIATALDQLGVSGGAQFLTSMGTDSNDIATKLVQGELQARQQRTVLTALLTGTVPTPTQGGNGGNQTTAQSTPSGDQAIAPTNTPEGPSAQAPASTQAANSTQETAVAQVLSKQTGLTVDALTTQLNAGSSTVAQLVTANNGDLNAVTTAIAAALDQMNASGAGQFISRLGTDSNDIATKIVQGQLQGRQQTLVLTALISGTTPSFGAGGNGGGFGGGNGGAAATATPQPTTALTPTATIMRPTLIVFPTDTPTPVGTEESTAEATGEATGEVSSGTGACTLVPTANLNLRDKPNKDTGIVMLSIPSATTVTATSRTSDGWYNVAFGGHTGWIDGQYAVIKGSCDSLPQATATAS